MHIENVIITSCFNLTGRGIVLTTNLNYDSEYHKFHTGDTIYFDNKVYVIRHVEGIVKKNDEGKLDDFVAFIVDEFIKKAAQVVLINEEGLILAVSRKDNHEDFGLPGGKQDPEDENEMAAAIRETKEETGLDTTDLQLIFVMHRSGYLGYTYLAKYSGEINHNEPHVVKWVPYDVIMNGSFGRFNILVAESLDSMGVKYKK